MEKIIEGVFQISEGEYENARKHNVIGNTGWQHPVGNVGYFVKRSTAGSYNLYESKTDSNSDGGTFYTLYQNVSKEFVKEISTLEVE